jgi:light-regulated signal transduction histidine kinase (bacteriophytochrome)
VSTRRPGSGVVDQRLRRGQGHGTDVGVAPEGETAPSAARDSATEQLLQAISHDLCQPLTTIAGFADLFARRYKERLDSDADEFISFIVTGAKRMRAMLDDLKAYLEIGDGEPPAAPVDCARLVQAAVDSLATPMAQTRATVTVGPLPPVRGDSAQLGQLLAQLLSNALNFTGERAPRINVCATREEGRVVFSVTDNGPGMDPSWSERAFELFERLHTPDGEVGTGAGLAICKKIVERHGGRIWHEPGPDGGSRFQFTIPDRKHPAR